MEKPLLELSTEIVRPQVVIDGVSYGLVIREELSMGEMHELRRQLNQFAGLDAKEAIAAGESTELSGVLDQLCRKLLPDVLDEVHAKLKDGHRVRLLETFLGIFLRLREGGNG